MKEKYRLWIVVALLCYGCFCIGQASVDTEIIISGTITVEYVPSLKEIQVMVGMEPNDVDGIYGDKTEAAWNKALNNQSAREHDGNFYER